VQALVHGELERGFVFAGLLREDIPVAVPVARRGTAAAVASAPRGIQVPEKALQLILTFEGMDQPSKWPGVSSGISLGRGCDLGYHTHDQFFGDWSPHLSPEVMQRLAKAMGKRGTAAKNMASQYRDITIKQGAADEVFIRSALPRTKAHTSIAFPGAKSLPPDVQGTLVSLVHNRGTDMNPGSDRRKEMHEIRELVADTSLTMPEKLSRIADHLRAMKRHWPNTLGLRRRREAKAARVESAI
jgi:hypothetical protein